MSLAEISFGDELSLTVFDTESEICPDALLCSYFGKTLFCKNGNYNLCGVNFNQIEEDCYLDFFIPNIQ